MLHHKSFLLFITVTPHDVKSYKYETGRFVN